MVTFEEYYMMNPRSSIPKDKDLQEFLKYAVDKYREMGESEGECVVNWVHNIEEDEIEDEVKSYLSDSMEALLLLRKFLMEKTQ